MRRILIVTAALAAITLTAGCSSGGGGTTKATGAPTIALLLPESKTTRYEAFDRPLFEAKVKQECGACTVLYFNADQDAAKQQNQFESALTQGADVIVFDAVNADAVAPQVNAARQKKIPVIAYDRLISGIGYDYYVSFDNVKVGRVQGEALLNEMARRGTTDRGQILMLNGAPTDPSAGDYKKGAHQALDGKVRIGREFDTPDWSPDKAQQETEQAITALGRDAIVGVYSANDGMASGAVAALKRAGYATLPPLTGQDGELAAVQRILTGEQTMTIYLNYRAQAEQTAELAVALGHGQHPPAPTKTNNGTADIPSFLLDAVAVSRDTVRDTIVKDGLYTVDQICAPDLAAACRAAGLK
ncbi:sugar ABC transporter substrate-binding protein [Nocardia terpenica]|uniref:ABC transporter substrate-binding protein n=1 Tax=Nocardia terpenica TaxID=455432 RepID=A0A291RTX2_9NOCA|nr:sugar ABC transporter substrate-binding protein [Nocardia terpenica]ATL70674.1 ABC transporter substrate-binding protein [Nocardia terpenica]